MRYPYEVNLVSDAKAALQSPERLRARADMANFPPFSGTIRHQIVEAQHSYDTAVSKGLTRDFARCLASELMKILSEVTGILKQISGRSLLNLDRRVA